MNYRVAFAVCFLLLIGSLLLNLTGQAQEVEVIKPVAPGRYTASTAQVTAGSVQVTVCDTFTGGCWVHTRTGKWIDLGSPVGK